MKKTVLLWSAAILLNIASYTQNGAVKITSSVKTALSSGCADVQLGISYIVPSFPGPAYVTVDVTWSVSQGSSKKGIVLTVNDNLPIHLSVSGAGQQSFYFIVPSGTYLTASAVPYSSPFPEKGKECSLVQLSVDIPT